MKIHTKISIIIVTILQINISCTNTNYEKSISDYLDKKEIEYEKLCVEAGNEVWNYYTDSTQNSMAAYKYNFSKLLLNDTLIDNINEWNRNNELLNNDTLIKRIEVWNRVLTCAQVNFDTEILEIQIELEKNLANYPDCDLSSHDIENNIIQLIKLRNEKAQNLGYGNYAYMILQNTGIDTSWFEQVIHKIDTSSKKAYINFISEEKLGDKELEYKDIRKYIIQMYQMNDNPVVKNSDKEDLIKSIVKNLGINLQELPIQFTLKDLPPGLGGFGNSINIPNDFRAVAMEQLSLYYLLHEIGHGLHWTGVKIKHPILKGYEWCIGNNQSLYYEAMAETIAKFSQNRNCLEKCNYSSDMIDSLYVQEQKLAPFYLRFNLIQSLYEIELYKNPEKSAAQIKHDLYKKYLFVSKDFSKKPNLIRISYVSYPIYEQNYLIADILMWQIHNHLAQKFGKDYENNKMVVEYLKAQLWKDGELFNWQEKLKALTNKEFDIDGYLKHKMIF
jgi:hypothetical protein